MKNQLAEKVGQLLLHHQHQLVTAESCTGGGVAQAITSVPGSSEWFERGFVTYSNEAKQESLDVDMDLLDRYGAVSEATAIAMAEGALRHSYAQISVAVTGIAGPDGGSDDKPVGLVWFAWAMLDGETVTAKQAFQGDRHAVQQQAIAFALSGILDRYK